MHHRVKMILICHQTAIPALITCRSTPEARRSMSIGRPVDKLCEFVDSCTHRSRMSFTFDFDKPFDLRQVEIPTAAAAGSDDVTAPSVRLNTILGTPTAGLSKMDRRYVAATVASTVVQLGSLAWLKRFWCNNDVAIRKSQLPARGTVSAPYIVKHYPLKSASNKYGHRPLVLVPNPRAAAD